MADKQVWYGMFQVKTKDGYSDLLHEAIGAFVNIVALAETSETYMRMAKKELDSAGFIVLDVENVMLFDDLLDESDKPLEKLKGLASILTLEYPIQFDDFNAYHAE